MSHFMVFSQDATDTAESALLASAMAMSDGALTPEQEEASTRAAKHLSLRRETVLQWLHQSRWRRWVGRWGWNLGQVGSQEVLMNRGKSRRERRLLKRGFVRARNIITHRTSKRTGGRW